MLLYKYFRFIYIKIELIEWDIVLILICYATMFSLAIILGYFKYYNTYIPAFFFMFLIFYCILKQRFGHAYKLERKTEIGNGRL